MIAVAPATKISGLLASDARKKPNNLAAICAAIFGSQFFAPELLCEVEGCFGKSWLAIASRRSIAVFLEPRGIETAPAAGNHRRGSRFWVASRAQRFQQVASGIFVERKFERAPMRDHEIGRFGPEAFEKNLASRLGFFERKRRLSPYLSFFLFLFSYL